MDYLRRHLFVIVCGLAAAGGIAAGVTGHQSMAKVQEKMKQVSGLSGQLAGLQSKPVNAAQIKSAQARIDTIVADYRAVVDEAKKLYEWKQLVPGALPYGEPQVLIDFRRRYHDALKALFDSLTSGSVATPGEVDLMHDRIEEESQQARELAREQGLTKPPDEGPQRDAAGVVTAAGAKVDAKVRANLAAAQRIYCYAEPTRITAAGVESRTVSSLDMQQGMAGVGTADPPYPDDVWRAQLGLWVQTDVVHVITTMNNAAAEAAKKAGKVPWVGIMPIKDVVSIRVPTDFIALDGPEDVYGAEPKGYGEALPPGTSGMVFTKTGSGEAFDVIQFTVKLVMDQRAIPEFVERLCNNSFHSPLRISYAAIPPNRDLKGKIYGSGPAVMVVMDFETVLLGEVFRRLMPVEIQDAYHVVCRPDLDDCPKP